jgi:hypothetical protein
MGLFVELFHRAASIQGTGKKKVDGEYAATRLGKPVTTAWLNERFRQTMLLIRQFRTEWRPGLISADDVEFLRVCLDVALATAERQQHVADAYDMNPTLWAIWLVQHVHAIKAGGWTVTSRQDLLLWSTAGMYIFLQAMSERGDLTVIRDPATKLVLHRYRLPFKNGMRVPPPENKVFAWKKGARRLSDWLEAGGLAPLHEEIIAQRPPIIVAPLPLAARREAQRAALWRRVARRASRRGLESVRGEGADAQETRAVVEGVMTDSRAAESSDESGLSDEAASELEADLERELEAQAEGQAGSSAPTPPPESLAEQQMQAIERFLLGSSSG